MCFGMFCVQINVKVLFEKVMEQLSSYWYHWFSSKNGCCTRGTKAKMIHIYEMHRLSRYQQTTIFRLRNGHCYLRSHLYRLACRTLQTARANNPTGPRVHPAVLSPLQVSREPVLVPGSCATHALGFRGISLKKKFTSSSTQITRSEVFSHWNAEESPHWPSHSHSRLCPSTAGGILCQHSKTFSVHFCLWQCRSLLPRHVIFPKTFPSPNGFCTLCYLPVCAFICSSWCCVSVVAANFRLF